jgi:chromosome segregation ATPase
MYPIGSRELKQKQLENRQMLRDLSRVKEELSKLWEQSGKEKKDIESELHAAQIRISELQEQLQLHATCLSITQVNLQQQKHDEEVKKLRDCMDKEQFNVQTLEEEMVQLNTVVSSTQGELSSRMCDFENLQRQLKAAHTDRVRLEAMLNLCRNQSDTYYMSMNLQ